MKILSNSFGCVVIYNKKGEPIYYATEGGEFKSAKYLNVNMFMQGITSDWIEELGGTRFEDVEDEIYPYPNLKREMEIRKNVSSLFMVIQIIIDSTWKKEINDKQYRKIIEDGIIENVKNIDEVIKRLKPLMKFIEIDKLLEYEYKLLQKETPKLNEVFQLLEERRNLCHQNQ